MGDQTEKKSPSEKIILRLFIGGKNSRSIRAIENLEKICEESLDGRKYEIDVIDVRKNPRLAREEHIVALPTLIRKLPPSMQQIIGDLSDKDKVLRALEVVSTTYWEAPSDPE